jgi:uncharacterized membrane protein
VNITQQFSRVLARSIDGLLEMRREKNRQRASEDRISDAITCFTGSLRFVYIHAVLFGGWIVWILGWIQGLPVFDPSFVALATLREPTRRARQLGLTPSGSHGSSAHGTGRAF